MALRKESLVFEMPGNGATVTKSLNIPLLTPFEVPYRVWASGDLNSNPSLTLDIAGQRILNGSYKNHVMPPATEREDADLWVDSTITLDENFFDVVVTTSHYVDGNPYGARVWIEFEYDSTPVLPDYYQDFTYARILQTMGETDTEVPVDSVERFPSNDVLATTNFLLTIESDLSTGAFEIVRLTEVNDQTNTITIIRGIEGTEPQPHPSFVTIKGALTSGMLRRISGVSVVDGVPEVNSDVYHEGSMAFDINAEMAYIFRNGSWSSFTLGLVKQIAGLAASLGRVATNVDENRDRFAVVDNLATIIPHTIFQITELTEKFAGREQVIADLGNTVVTLANYVDDLESDLDERVTSVESMLDLDPVTAAIALGG